MDTRPSRVFTDFPIEMNLRRFRQPRHSYEVMKMNENEWQDLSALMTDPCKRSFISSLQTKE